MNTVTTVTPTKLDAETQKFFDQWENVVVVDLVGKIFPLKNKVKEIVPENDGTLKVVWKDTKPQNVKIHNKVAEGLFLEKHLLPCFHIVGLVYS